MTWTKTGAEFPDEAFGAQLSDAAYRTHHEVTTYLFKLERTDCNIRVDEVRKIACSPHADMAVQELVGIGWWRLHGQGYELLQHADIIRSGIAVQVKKRATSKATSQRYRARHAEATVTPDVTPDVTRHADRQTDKQLEGPPQNSWNDITIAEIEP
jgi:hypothetical protein